ncbi:MAG: TIGR04211 family SH3 domain-containing protein [Motiliproteus sp.]|nr:TIGR04211 family SH3 domain-containing protein [Motiliproteus sp.]
MRKVLVLALGLLYTITSPAAEPYHVTDDVKIYMHRGPSNQFKIKSRPSAGTPVTLLARNSDTGYVQVRTNSGTVGWIEGRYLKKGSSIKQRLPDAERALKQSQDKQSEQAVLIKKLTSELASVKQKSSTELAQINESRAKTTAQVAQLENEIVRLQTEIDGMDETNLMGWFLRGGALAIVGIIIGLIIPNLPKRRRRNDDWF